jgi:malic enzyme
MFYEVKGWWDHRSLLVKRLMSEQYPEINIEYIDEPRYKSIEQNFKDQINGWE